jgi:hypothetical protein
MKTTKQSVSNNHSWELYDTIGWYIKQAKSSEPRKKKNATTFNSHAQGEKQIGPRLLVWYIHKCEWCTRP